MRFYTLGRFAHELALLKDASYRNQGNSGMAHLCFNAASEADLRALYRRCRQYGVNPGNGVDHVIMHSFYLADPDGHVIEIGVDQPKSAWAELDNPFARDYPLDLQS
jgi:catechol 2,3-dioxygenase